MESSPGDGGDFSACRRLDRRDSGRGDPVSGIRILIAEDNYINHLVAREILEDMGCGVDIAADGKEALEMLELLPYDAIFMDCQMPEMDGFEATARIRKREEEGGAHIPIIAMTANAMQGDRERCLAAGMAPLGSGGGGARSVRPVRGASFQRKPSRPRTLEDLA